ncbi:MAG: extracellular solute-binding protein [Defluviitaleaceae bacterium]|nr:extracellular solute-binding protein [Defluviitaleaceae bacterium]
MNFGKRIAKSVSFAGMLAGVTLFASACGNTPPATTPEYTPGSEFHGYQTQVESGPDISGTTLVIYTTFNAHFVGPIITAFEEATGAIVDVALAGTGELLARLEEESDDPQADVLWGGAMFSVAPVKHLFEDYISANEPYMLDVHRNVEGPFTRFNTSGRLMMVNTDILAETGITITGYADLLLPELRGRIAITDPVESGSSFNHLVNQLFAMGYGNPHDGWGYMRAFVENVHGIMLPDSNAVIRGVVDGDFVVGLTFEEAPWPYIQSGAPVDVVYISEGIVATSSVVSVVAGAPNRDAARAFIDFVTGYDIQSIMETELFRRPVRADVPSQGILPGNEELVWIPYDVEYVLENRDAWLDKFEEIWMELN